MLEGAYWGKKLRPLLTKHQALRDAIIIKHANHYSGGLPDFSITLGRCTHWFELKMYPNTPSKLQALMLEQLGDGGHLITVRKDSIDLDSLRFCTPNPLLTLVEEIVAICTSKV